MISQDVSLFHVFLGDIAAEEVVFRGEDFHWVTSVEEVQCTSLLMMRMIVRATRGVASLTAGDAAASANTGFQTNTRFDCAE